MKRQRKTVQVFTRGDVDYCEVDGVLINYEIKDDFITIQSLAEDGTSKDVWTHIFPSSHVTMVRIHEAR